MHTRSHTLYGNFDDHTLTNACSPKHATQTRLIHTVSMATFINSHIIDTVDFIGIVWDSNSDREGFPLRTDSDLFSFIGFTI